MSASNTARITEVRVCAALLLSLGCAACHGEPSFDEKYARQQRELASEAQSMNAELEQRMTEKPGLEASEPSAPEAPAT